MPQQDDPSPSQLEAINAEASRLMKCGIDLMSEGPSSAVREALDYFSRALELRKALPVDTDPLLRYGLAACWLNRADALAKLGGEELSAALGSYDAGIEVLALLPLAADHRFPRRLAIAHQNRALSLQAYSGHGDGEAIAGFAQALAILETEDAARIPDRQYLLAAVWMNLANAHASDESDQGAEPARQAALHAIAYAKPLEESDAAAAGVGIRARHILCQALTRVPLSDAGAANLPSEIHEASDAVDEGLALVRLWERKGVTGFRDLADDLLRFGVRIYARFQPHFLGEFVRENTDAALSSAGYVESDGVRAAVREALEMGACVKPE